MPFRKGSSDRSPRSGRRMRRVARILGIVALALVALVLVSASVNAILTRQERSRFAPHGQRVSVDGGSLNVWRNEHAGATMVLLSGLGTAAPALDSTPLIRQLGAYNVFVVEGFGYGYSDTSARPRTVENITAELHDALAKLGAPKPYILVGHGGTSGLPLDTLGSVLRLTGLVRAAYTLVPGLAEPDGNAYTPDQRAQIRAMTIRDFGNAAVSDEINRTGSNASALHGVSYPDGLPVLDFLASEKVATDPNWVRLHEDQLSSVRRHEIVVLDGGHYLHWTQSRAMADKITVFLDANLAPP